METDRYYRHDISWSLAVDKSDHRPRRWRSNCQFPMTFVCSILSRIFIDSWGKWGSAWGAMVPFEEVVLIQRYLCLVPIMTWWFILKRSALCSYQSGNIHGWKIRPQFWFWTVLRNVSNNGIHFEYSLPQIKYYFITFRSSYDQLRHTPINAIPWRHQWSHTFRLLNLKNQ